MLFRNIEFQTYEEYPGSPSIFLQRYSSNSLHELNDHQGNRNHPDQQTDIAMVIPQPLLTSKRGVEEYPTSIYGDTNTNHDLNDDVVRCVDVDVVEWDWKRRHDVDQHSSEEGDQAESIRTMSWKKIESCSKTNF